MNRPLPESPIDIRALVLYDIHQWKTAGTSYESYEKLCDRIGEKVISYDDYEYWFNQYHKEEYLARRENDASGTAIVSRDYLIVPLYTLQYLKKSGIEYYRERFSLIKSDTSKPDIRGCILSDVINGKSAEKSLNDLCEAFEDHKVDKEDHGYWYKRFGNGGLFTRIIFSDLPNEIIAEIVGKCDHFRSYLSLRNVSRRLRNIVDRSKPAFTSISVDVADDFIQFMLNDKESLIYVEEEEFEPEDTVMTLNCLKLILSNPKLQLDSLHIVHWQEAEREMFEMILDVFNSLNHQLHVKHFSFRTPYVTCVPDVVKHLKPGVLEKLTLARQEDDQMIVDQLYGMEQWKQAKHVDVDDVFISIEHFSHFTSFDVSIPMFSAEEVVGLINAVSTFINFKSCRLEILDLETVKDMLNLQQTASPKMFSIPNSDSKQRKTFILNY
ncbi:hypothetical protein GCK72_021039 [Caenorhabditis remanei]|uniref:F-box domain-containing protein n=1 Tax=Caenorhabditis remanei TaxID=31234 RepID=A0A6A5GIG3_CAERE|nr:hypothetical protein GCK72_021039 [Caenorhabditis remanei]KAF1754476.1 hypothetical protein GCK72_021039 [Caenorhabditis remanei]